jgi:hypothetical protein
VRYPHPRNSSLQGAKANRANGGNMKIKRYLDGLDFANNFFSEMHGYEIVISDEDLLRKVFSVVEKIRKKITLKHYNLVTVSLYFKSADGIVFLVKFTRKYKSLVVAWFIKTDSPFEENTISIYVSFTKENNVYERSFLDRDIEVIKEILNFHKMNNYKQTSTLHLEIIESFVPIRSQVIKYII